MDEEFRLSERDLDKEKAERRTQPHLSIFGKLSVGISNAKKGDIIKATVAIGRRNVGIFANVVDFRIDERLQDNVVSSSTCCSVISTANLLFQFSCS